MKRTQIQKRLEITVRQVSLLEQCIADAKEHQNEFNPKIYNAMIAGYKSLRDELQEEINKYRIELDLHQ